MYTGAYDFMYTAKGKRRRRKRRRSKKEGRKQGGEGIRAADKYFNKSMSYSVITCHHLHAHTDVIQALVDCKNGINQSRAAATV